MTRAKLRIDPIITPWFVVVHVVALVGPFFYTSWGAVAVAFALYLVTGLFGITLGYHRLLTHRTFKAPRWVERVLGTCGMLAMQRGPLDWIAHHRMHHAGVDTDADPHNARRGFFWSHIGWLVYYQPEIHDPVRLRKFARDIVADPYLYALTPLWVQVVSQAALGALLWLVGGLDYVVWGIFVRLFVVYHITWLVNSATHLWGYRSYETLDLSTNCWWVGLLAFGEGWHNNHHSEQDAAPAWRRPWEIDVTWYVIRIMAALGLAWDIKMPRLAPSRAILGFGDQPLHKS